MKWVVRSSKMDVVKHQLISVLMLNAVDIIVSPTDYRGITLLSLDKTAVPSIGSIRNIEALILDEETASLLLHPTNASEANEFKSLHSVDEHEQYEHLCHLLHIQKGERNNDEIVRN